MGDKSPKDKQKKQAQRDAVTEKQRRTLDTKQTSYDHSVSKGK